MDQTGVRHRQDRGNRAPVERSREHHIVQTVPQRFTAQGIQPGTVADQQEYDVGTAALQQEPSRPQHHLEPMCHTDSPAVGDAEAAGDAQPIGQLLISVPG